MEQQEGWKICFFLVHFLSSYLINLAFLACNVTFKIVFLCKLEMCWRLKFMIWRPNFPP